jgi:hypothetical protein
MAMMYFFPSEDRQIRVIRFMGEGRHCIRLMRREIYSAVRQQVNAEEKV